MSRILGSWQRPGVMVYPLVALLHFISVQLSFFCGLTPENSVVIWLPNAILLAALLRFRGRGMAGMIAATFSSDVLANVAPFGWLFATLFSLVNLGEVLLAYMLMRRFHMSPSLKRIQDLRIFLIMGPLLAALLAGLAGGALLLIKGAETSYLTMARVWWFGDALGLMVLTPLLLAFSTRQRERIEWRVLDVLILGLGVLLFSLVLSADGARDENVVSVTPSIMLPIILYIASRFGLRWSATAVLFLALITAWLLTNSHRPFGDVPLYLAVVRAQEFILTICVVGTGFTCMLNELRMRERLLEARVIRRTHDLEVLNSQLAMLSATDGLTGIANRRRFDESLAQEWQRAWRNQEPVALMMIDVDLFKQYNDYYGHQSGDDCLREIARLVGCAARRGGDLAARYGGEEFVFIAPQADADQALLMAQALCNEIKMRCIEHAKSPFGFVTVSIGVAVVVPDGNAKAERLLALADMALYRAKQDGRNRVCLAAP